MITDYVPERLTPRPYREPTIDDLAIIRKGGGGDPIDWPHKGGWGERVRYGRVERTPVRTGDGGGFVRYQLFPSWLCRRWGGAAAWQDRVVRRVMAPRDGRPRIDGDRLVFFCVAMGRRDGDRLPEGE